jgi:hypothetical protein
MAYPILVTIPPSRPPMGDVIVEGLATTRATPLDRIAIRPWSIPIPPWEMDAPKVRLLYKHDVAQPAGVIERIEHDALGQIRLRARVNHPFGKRSARFRFPLRFWITSCATSTAPTFMRW